MATSYIIAVRLEEIHSFPISITEALILGWRKRMRELEVRENSWLQRHVIVHSAFVEGPGKRPRGPAP